MSAAAAPASQPDSDGYVWLKQPSSGGSFATTWCGCLPVAEYGEAWPKDVSVQVHGKDADPFFAEDLEAAQALVDSTDRAELFLYPGEEHLFADPSLPEYDAAAATLLTERVLAFLEMVEAEQDEPDDRHQEHGRPR